MCGICGITTKQKNLDQQSLDKMVVALKHRGPDDCGQWQGQTSDGCRIFFGQTRLSIIDLSPAGHQPMINEDGSCRIIFNGEIYNFLELRQKLLAKGHIFKSQTDTEVLLHLYEDYGIDFLKQLRGMFALALWDSKKQQLVLARDRFGIKPLYFSWCNGLLVFASETQAIIKSGLVSKEINHRSVFNYLNFLSVPPPHTIWQNIYCLLPAHYAIYKNNDVKINSYWHLHNQKTVIPKNNNEVIAYTKKLLQETISQHLLADVPVGIFLSGGIDSSALVSLASQDKTQSLKTLSVVFQEKQFDERAYAKQVAQQFKTDHQEISLSAKQVLKSIPSFIQAMDQPTGDGLNTYLISRVAMQAGLTVVLSGLGGDELFGGYRYYQSLPRLYERFKLFRSLSKSGRRLMGWLPAQLVAGDLDLSRALELWSSPLDLFDYYLASRTIFPLTWQKKLLGDCSSPATTLEKKIMMCYRNQAKRIGDLFNQLSFLDTKFYLAQTLLPDTDVMSMANSLEARVPFLDHILWEYVSNLPSSFKQGVMPKQLLLSSLPQALSQSLISRPKMGFTFPFDLWLKNEWRGWLSGFINSLYLRQHSYFQYGAIKQLSQLFLAGKISWSRLWTVLVFELWYQQNL